MISENYFNSITFLVRDDDDQLEFDIVDGTSTKNIKVFSTFDSMGLRDELIRGIYAYGNYFILII